MQAELKNDIKKNYQIKKFSWYGLLKNLRFFEPYLLIYLLADGITYTQIGLLMAIREVIIYVFEIPSGVLADKFGKKKEMLLCFSFYIVSFVFFFLQAGFGFYVVAMVFYGLGDAFRTGTHKAMIMQYLQQQNWGEYKSFVYGRTRSFSLIGSAISSLLSVLLVLYLPGLRWIFLVCILPYLADFLLILSYPKNLDRTEDGKVRFNLKMFYSETWLSLKAAFSEKTLRKTLLNSSSFQGTVKTIKDYVQPLLVSTLAVGFIISEVSEDKTIKIVLGLFYCVMNLLNSAASRNAYRFSDRFGDRRIINITFILLSAAIFFTGLASLANLSILIMILFILINTANNIRRPILIGNLSDKIKANQRASVLSIESQITSFYTAAGAFLIGYSIDRIGLSYTFLILGVLLGLLQIVVSLKGDEGEQAV
ncbi:MAG: MFS transporter [Anaerolineaceae bacterium]|nr:MFS transporter [Anaerolineaceae bacterium]